MSSGRDNNSYKPDWVPENHGDEFAIKIVKGVERKEEKNSVKNIKRKELTIEDYSNGVLNGERTLLARTITLIESNSEKHRITAKDVLQKLMPYTGNSIRVGISGVPGAGKSTLIETLGLYLIEGGHKVAVLTVDPSSSLTGGSILGDKTRMEKLSRETNAFIRPSPSGGALGGVAPKTRETILVCEAAGFDVILVETVGVGQNEITVRSMVDFFTLVLIPGGGDELQGIKKGVMELSDAVLINKADGNNVHAANRARAEYSNALHYLANPTKGWNTNAYTCSALTGDGIKDYWKLVEDFRKITTGSGVFENRRKEQSLEWVFGMIEYMLKEEFYKNTSVKNEMPGLKERILTGSSLPTAEAEKLLKLYLNSR